MLQLILKQNSEFDTKFDEQKNEMQEFKSSVNVKLDIQNTELNKRFDVLTNSLCSIEDRMNEICREIKESRAVSYTHLDVYKRQVICFVNLIAVHDNQYTYISYISYH